MGKSKRKPSKSNSLSNSILKSINNIKNIKKKKPQKTKKRKPKDKYPPKPYRITKNRLDTIKKSLKKHSRRSRRSGSLRLIPRSSLRPDPDFSINWKRKSVKEVNDYIIQKHTASITTLHKNKDRSRSKSKSGGGGGGEDIFDKLPPYGILDPEGKYLNPLNRLPYSERYFEFSLGIGAPPGKTPWSKLPTYIDRAKFFNMLHNNNVILFVSGTGSGKTVLVPKFMLHYFDYQCQIAITIPKTGIAESASGFSAKCLDVIEGEHVGFVHGNNKTMYDRRYTNLIYMTEGILLAQMIGSDPDLKQYSGVIIDEAHERSINVDILILLLRELLYRRPEFKLVLMSATVNESVFKDYFDQPGLNFDIFEPSSSGTIYPITDQFSPKLIAESQKMDPAMEKLKHLIHKTEGGHIILFVATKSEADQVCRVLKQELETANQHPVCFEYYSGIGGIKKELADANKDKLEKMGYGRKIITATNAVESSVTIDDTEYVIDMGIEYKIRFDPVKSGYVRGVQHSTQAQIKQRCGRTGRTNPGYCIRIYSESQFKSFKKYPDPAIQDENFTNTLLDLSGQKQAGNLPKGLELVKKMIEIPRKELLKHAVNNLFYLNLIDSQGNITDIGWSVRRFNKLTVEQGITLLASYYLECEEEVTIILAMLALGKLDDWISKPKDTDIKKPGQRTVADYKRDIKKLSEYYFDSGDHFVLLALYDESCDFDCDNDRSKWCRAHGYSDSLFRKLQPLPKYRGGHMPPNKGDINEMYNQLNRIRNLPYMFEDEDEDNQEAPKDLMPQQGGERTFQRRRRARRSQNLPRQLPRKLPRFRPQRGGRAKKKPKVNLQQQARENQEEKAKRVFSEYNMPTDDELPFKPEVEYMEDKVKCAFYYGYHRQIGCFMDGKKYKSKVSPENGSISGSSYDTLDLPKPPIVIYDQLDIALGDYGPKVAYQTVMGIDEELLQQFF